MRPGDRGSCNGLVGAGLVAVLLLFLDGLLADLLTRLGRCRHHYGSVAHGPGCPPAIRPGPHLCAHSKPRRCRWRDCPGRAPGDHGGNRPCHPVVLSPKLVAPRQCLGEVPEMGGWYCTARYPGATQLSGLVVFRWEAPRFFANSGQFRDKVRRLARERPRPGSFCSARWSLTSMSMRSTMRPRTTLCRPMKGCRLHEHRP